MIPRTGFKPANFLLIARIFASTYLHVKQSRRRFFHHSQFSKRTISEINKFSFWYPEI